MNCCPNNTESCPLWVLVGMPLLRCSHYIKKKFYPEDSAAVAQKML